MYQIFKWEVFLLDYQKNRIKFSVVDKKIIIEIVFLYLDNSILLQTQIIIKGKIKITYFGEITPALKIEYEITKKYVVIIMYNKILISFLLKVFSLKSFIK